MEKEVTEIESTKSSKNKKSKGFWLKIVSFIFSVPLAFYINRFVPVFYLFEIEVDLIITFVITYIAVSAIFDKYRIISIIIVFTLFGYITHRFIKNGKSDVVGMFKSYFIMVDKMKTGRDVQEVVDQKPVNVIKPHVSFQQRMINKVDFKDSVVRNFAVEKSLLYFDEFYPKYNFICREFSLIKYIRQHFKYVRDPKGVDYLASPSETIKTMGGDCDDHSILLASTIKSIGGNVRFVLAPGHIYPELFCGDAALFDTYVSAIRTLFSEESSDKVINFREDQGKFWLNIDYTDNYPGAKYMSDTVVSIIYL